MDLFPLMCRPTIIGVILENTARLIDISVILIIINIIITLSSRTTA